MISLCKVYDFVSLPTLLDILALPRYRSINLSSYMCERAREKRRAGLNWQLKSSLLFKGWLILLPTINKAPCINTLPFAHIVNGATPILGKDFRNEQSISKLPHFVFVRSFVNFWWRFVSEENICGLLVKSCIENLNRLKFAIIICDRGKIRLLIISLIYFASISLSLHPCNLAVSL